MESTIRLKTEKFHLEHTAILPKYTLSFMNIWIGLKPKSKIILDLTGYGLKNIKHWFLFFLLK